MKSTIDAISLKKRKEFTLSLLFLLPALVLFFAFLIYPVINAIYLSFRSWKGIYGAPKIFIGWNNYIKVFSSTSFWNSMLNCLYFLIGGFVILMPISFMLALLITSNLKATRLMKTAYFMPVMLSGTAVSLMWVYLLNPDFGFVNEFLQSIGLSRYMKDWLSIPTVNIWSVVFVNEWMYAGYNMLIFAAGLVAIPKSLYEAAEIDGCSGFKRVLHISIPLSKESFKIFSVLCITGCIKQFDMVWAMTKGGPNHSSEVPATLLYNEAFTFKHFGRSSAIGVILLILGVGLSLFVNKFLSTKDV